MASEHRLNFDLEYPCPKDRKLLAKLHMGADEFQSLVGASSSDAELDRKLNDANPAAYKAARAALLRFARNAKGGTASGLRPTKNLSKGDNKHLSGTRIKSLAEDADGC